MILNLPKVIAFAMLPAQLSAGKVLLSDVCIRLRAGGEKIPVVHQYVRVDHTVNMTVLASV